MFPSTCKAKNNVGAFTFLPTTTRAVKPAGGIFSLVTPVCRKSGTPSPVFSSIPSAFAGILGKGKRFFFYFICFSNFTFSRSTPKIKEILPVLSMAYLNILQKKKTALTTLFLTFHLVFYHGIIGK